MSESAVVALLIYSEQRRTRDDRLLRCAQAQSRNSRDWLEAALSSETGRDPNLVDPPDFPNVGRGESESHTTNIVALQFGLFVSSKGCYRPSAAVVPI